MLQSSSTHGENYVGSEHKSKSVSVFFVILSTKTLNGFCAPTQMLALEKHFVQPKMHDMSFGGQDPHGPALGLNAPQTLIMAGVRINNGGIMGRR